MTIYSYLNLKIKLLAALASKEERSRLFDSEIAREGITFTLDDSYINLNNIDEYLAHVAPLINMTDNLTVQI